MSGIGPEDLVMYHALAVGLHLITTARPTRHTEPGESRRDDG